MYYIYWQEQNKIEIALTGELTREEFLQVIHQLESLCTMYQEISSDQINNLSEFFPEMITFASSKIILEKAV